MILYLLRHGIAVERGTRGFDIDAERPLLKKGVRQLKQSAKALKRMDLGIDMIFSSPLTRCQQTASIVEESLGLHTKTVDVLSPDADPAQLCVMLAQHDTKSILLVGHEPNISEFISKLISGTNDVQLDVPKGGLVRIDIVSATLSHSRCAELKWFLTPEQMKLIGKKEKKDKQKNKQKNKKT